MTSGGCRAARRSSQADSVTDAGTAARTSRRADATRSRRAHAAAVAVGHGRLARLAVRRAGHAPLHARRGARSWRSCSARPSARRPGREGEERVHPGGVPGRLGAGRRILRPPRRPPRPQPCALAHHPHLRPVHRPVAFAQTWWQLMLFRFIAALGIGGEWAVGASLLSETWPKAWRPWIAAVLQTGVNLGILARGAHRRPAVARAAAARRALRVPRRRAAGVPRVLDSPSRAGAGGVAARARETRDARPRARDLFRGDVASHHRCARRSTCALGAFGLVAVPVLAVAAPAPTARRRRHASRARSRASSRRRSSW